MSNLDSEESDKRGRKILILSIILNLLFVPVSGYVLMQNIQLRDQIGDLSSSLNELTELSRSLEQQFNLSENQVEYYKELALYYSSSEADDDTAAHVLGFSSIPIVAVQTVQTGFYYEYQGVVMA